MTYKKIDGKTSSEAGVLQDYFGRKEGQTLQEFMAECKSLTATDKTELANLAAAAMGYTEISEVVPA